MEVQQDDLSTQYLSQKESDVTLDNRAWLQKLVVSPDKSVEAPKSEPVPKQEPSKESFMGKLLGGYKKEFSNALDVVKGTVETAATLVTGAAAWPISKAGGLMTMPFWGGEEAQKFEEYVSNMYTYQPKGKIAQEATEKVGKAMEIPFKPAKWLGDIVEKITGSPEAKYGVTAVGEVATMLLIPKVTAKVKKATGITKPVKEVKSSDLAAAEEKPTVPPTKGEKLSQARGDLTAEMEKVNDRARTEVEKAINEIPKEEWDKVLKEDKPVNISDVQKLVENQAERLKKEREAKGSDYEKLPQSQKDAIAKEEATARERAKNLDKIVKDADKVDAELIIVPEVLNPRPEVVKQPRPGYQGPPPIIGEVPKEGVLPPEMVAEKAAAAKQARVAEAFSKQPFERTAEDKLILNESAGIIEGQTDFRSFGEIARDLKKIVDLDETGAISGQPLSPDKIAAYKRLKGDMDTISKNAKKVGKTVEEYLTDLGFDPEVIAYLGEKAQSGAKKQTEQMVGEPPPDVRVNLNRISNTESIRNVIADIDLKQQKSGRIAETTRGVRPHETTIAASQTEKGKVTLEKVLSRKPGEMWNAEQMQSVRDLRTSAAKTVKELTDKSLSGDLKAANDLPSAIAIFGELHAQDVGIGAEVGRALESRKIISEPGRQPFDPKQLADLAQAVADSAGDPILLAKRIKALETTPQKATFARQLVAGLKKAENIFTFAWINGLLSGPPTHVVNFASNASVFLAGIENRRLAARIGQVREVLGGREGVQVGEAGEMIHGSIEGFMNALKTSRKAWMDNETQFGESKIENYQKNPLSREALGLTESYNHSIEFLANTIEKVGDVIGVPGRGLMVADEFWKSLNYRAELHALAFREAKLEGLSGDTFGKRVKYITENPEQFDSINKSAIEFAEKQTFTNELGRFGKAVQSAANSTAFTKVILPFVRTPANILKYTQDYTPGLNMISRRFWEDIHAGGARADIASSKMAMGSMFVATAAYLAKNGLITGNGPSDPKLRKVWLEDNQPNSIKVGDEWVRFDRMDFPGNVFALTANTITMIDDMDLDSADQYLSAAALATADVMVNKTYLKGLSDALDAVRSPDKRASNYIKQWSKSLVPNIIKTGNRVFFDQANREVNSVNDALMSGTPGMSEYLPPMRGFWGQPIFPDYLGPDILSPYAVKKNTHDPVNEEILANRIQISMPNKVLGGYKPSESVLQENMPRTGWGIKLTPEQYDRYVVLSRNEVKIGGKNLHEKLSELIESPTYKRQSDGADGGKSLLIRTWVNQYEQVAQGMLRKEFRDLDTNIKQQQIKRAGAMRPTP